MTSIENTDNDINSNDNHGLIACHECDYLHTIEPLPPGGKALCVRCGYKLYENIPNSLERCIALNLTALMLLIFANIFPFISLNAGGRVEETLFISGAITLWTQGMGELGILVFLTSCLFPFLTIAGLLYILIPLRFNFQPWKMARVYRIVNGLIPWSLLSVFMLGLLLSFIKLVQLADVIPGTSLYFFAALLVIISAARSNLDNSIIWPPMITDPGGYGSGKTAAERNLVSCHTCSLLLPQTHCNEHESHFCPRCNTPLHSRKTNSISRTGALVFAALLLCIPANAFPVMTIIQFGRGAPDTIMSGVKHLIEDGMWPLGLIVFFASIMVPIAKLIVLVYLMILVKIKSTWRLRDHTVLYRVTEVIGAWSMVDIYILAFLVALVKFGYLATVLPEIGAIFFSTMVVITIVAAQCFDPRLIWDNLRLEIE